MGVTIEQDAAYWEVHIQIPNDGEATEVMFGVATKKDRKFYKAFEEQEEGTWCNRDIMAENREKQLAD